MRTVNWHAASNHEFPIPGMQFEAMKRGDRRAIGEGGGCWNIYLHLSIFLPTRGIFFFYRDPWVPPDTSVCIVFTRIIWYIGLFLFSLSLSFSLAYDGTLCDQRRNHRAWISTRYRLSLGRQRIDDEPIKFIIFAGKAEQVDVSKRDPGVDCGYLPDDCSFRYTKQLSDCFHAFAWSLKRIYAGVYMYKFETVWNCLKSIDD